MPEEKADLECPKCGKPTQTVDRVREQSTVGFGDFIAEARIVRRATCVDGHQWFPDERRLQDFGNEREREASRTWIRGRLTELASANGVKIDDVQFLPLPRNSNEMLHVRGHGRRARVEIRSETLSDLHNDLGEQAQMDVRLRDLLSQISAKAKSLTEQR